METAELTTMCMIRDPQTGQVLVQNRRKSWCGLAFPGGHVEPGESFVQSAKREVLEETGLTVSNLSLCGIKDFYLAENNKRYMVFLFQTECFEGELLKDHEEGEAFWVDPALLPAMELASGFGFTLETMLSPALCEHFIYPDEGNPSTWKDALLA